MPGTSASMVIFNANEKGTMKFNQRKTKWMNKQNIKNHTGLARAQGKLSLGLLLPEAMDKLLSSKPPTLIIYPMPPGRNSNVMCTPPHMCYMEVMSMKNFWQKMCTFL